MTRREVGARCCLEDRASTAQSGATRLDRIWFNNVEPIAGELGGRQTVDDVSGIYK